VGQIYSDNSLNKSNMSNYIIRKEYTIELVESAIGQIEITLPAVIDPALYELTFTAFDQGRKVLFEKVDTDFVKIGQTITANVNRDDTEGNTAQKYRWTLWAERTSPVAERFKLGQGQLLLHKKETP
jgi:hypothetical protein